MCYMFVPSTNVSLHVKHSTHLKSGDVVTGRVLEMEPSTPKLQMRRVRTRSRKGRIHVTTRGLGGAKPGAWDTVGPELWSQAIGHEVPGASLTSPHSASVSSQTIRRILEMHRLSGECDD